MAVSPQTADESRAMGLPFPTLSDPDLEVTKKYGLVHPKAYGGKDAPRPTTIVLGQGGLIRWIRAAESIRHRPAPDEVLARVRS